MSGAASAPAAHRFAPELLLQAQGVRCAFFDVDGVLTDGSLLLSAEGETLKRFHALDGHGLKLLERVGIAVVVISGRDSAPLRRRMADLGIADLRLGIGNKLPEAEAALAARGLDWGQAAAIGDDWPDLPLLERAAFAAAPPGAHPEVLERVHWVCDRPAGAGAARRFCDLLLTAGGHYGRLLRAEQGTLDGR